MEGLPPFHQIIYILNFSYKKTTSVKHCCRSLNNTWLVQLKMFRSIDFFSLKVHILYQACIVVISISFKKTWMKPILEALAICLPDHSLYMYDRTTSKIQWWTSSAQALTQGRSLKAFRWKSIFEPNEIHHEESIYMSKQHCIARCFAQHTQVKTRY